jgi:hypothetical protein
MRMFPEFTFVDLGCGKGRALLLAERIRIQENHRRGLFCQSRANCCAERSQSGIVAHQCAAWRRARLRFPCRAAGRLPVQSIQRADHAQRHAASHLPPRYCLHCLRESASCGRYFLSAWRRDRRERRLVHDLEIPWRRLSDGSRGVWCDYNSGRGFEMNKKPGASDFKRAPSAGEREWEEKTLAPTLAKSPERSVQFTTVSGYPIRRLYTAADLAGWDTERDLGVPGRAALHARHSPERCTARACGRCANSRASARRATPTRASATCCRRGRRAFRWLSICPR